MRGSVTKRGKASFRIKFDYGPDPNGKRLTHVETVEGSRTDAVALLAKRLTGLWRGLHVSHRGAADLPCLDG